MIAQPPVPWFTTTDLARSVTPERRSAWNQRPQSNVKPS